MVTHIQFDIWQNPNSNLKHDAHKVFQFDQFLSVYIHSYHTVIYQFYGLYHYYTPINVISITVFDSDIPTHTGIQDSKLQVPSSSINVIEADSTSFRHILLWAYSSGPEIVPLHHNMQYFACIHSMDKKIIWYHM